MNNKLNLQVFIKNNGSLFIFLAIELLLFTSINLANYGSLFRYFAIILAVLTLPYPILKCKKSDWIALAWLAVPLFIFGLLMSSSVLYFYLQTAFDNIAMLLGLLSFLLVGFSLRHSGEFSLQKGLTAIFIGVGLLLLISLVWTMYRYSIFYVSRYVGQVIYFDGEQYVVSAEAKWLFGFSFKEVKIAYFGMFATVMAACLNALWFVDFKKLKPIDLAWIIAGAVGVLGLVLLPYIAGLKYLAILTIAFAIFRFFPRNVKILKILEYGALIGVVLVVIAGMIFLLNAFEIPAISNFVRGNTLLNYLYNNGRVSSFSAVTAEMFKFPFGGLHPVVIGTTYIESTGSFLFDTIYQGGIFAALGIVGFLFFGARQLVIFYLEGNEPRYIKILVIAFISSYFFYTMFDFQYSALIRENDRIYKSPFYSDLLLLITVFLMGYSVASTKKKEATPIKEEASVELDMM